MLIIVSVMILDYRTDLALERTELFKRKELAGLLRREVKGNMTKTTVMEIVDSATAKRLGKPCGKYITVEAPLTGEWTAFDERLDVLISAVKELLPAGDGLVLAAGVGNPDITSDALGPFFASQIFSTRHISGEIKKEYGFLGKLRPVASVSTGVLGQTGLESSEYIRYIAHGIKPVCIITVDALASKSLSRLGCTIQLCDTGISPGSGVGNARKRIDKEYMGVPVIAIGVPTVVSVSSLAAELCENGACFNGKTSDMIVTPKDIDVLVKNASHLLALAVNCALQPTLSPEEINALM